MSGVYSHYICDRSIFLIRLHDRRAPSKITANLSIFAIPESLAFIAKAELEACYLLDATPMAHAFLHVGSGGAAAQIGLGAESVNKF
jgi:hypothetical protein